MIYSKMSTFTNKYLIFIQIDISSSHSLIHLHFTNPDPVQNFLHIGISIAVYNIQIIYIFS